MNTRKTIQNVATAAGLAWAALGGSPAVPSGQAAILPIDDSPVPGPIAFIVGEGLVWLANLPGDQPTGFDDTVTVIDPNQVHIVHFVEVPGVMVPKVKEPMKE